ncbi:hypothetical protein PPERSA_07506 [Pseudocohnilembus persalinus]|uniref:Transmembrane protein n=1 Tax=Pseudocohnilembus persalinus TaxID=266149 RepID=A0A0V0QZN1_PSEPJ|nr:hypothetical protein PPERSA_07506 [Pseudocohnilembus persalinus]|eukprot:KRX07756.1 hypothetical protein PPERSA_07506 [Pseudocohnilembus persalinus]
MGETFDLSAFTLLNSVKMMWQAKVYPLSFIIALFSGVWPSSKIIGMAVCWFMPLNKLSFKKRESFLRFLDAVGKWSLIDSYFLLLMLVAFSFDIDLKLFGMSMSFKIFVTPLFNFYNFVTATMLSLILTHIVIHYHRKTHELSVQKQLDQQSLIQANEMKICLGQGQTQFQKYFVLLVGTAGLILLISGYVLPMYTFTFEGLAGYALGEDSSYIYSLLSLGILIPFKTDDPYTFGIRYLQVLYFLFTFFIPFAFFTLVLVLQYINIKLKYAKNLFAIAEILYAWSSIDVLALALISSLLQIRKFAQYMIGDKCQGINNIIAVLKKLYPNKFDFEGDTCFDVKTSLNMATTLLIAVSVILFVFGTFVIRKQQKYLYEKLKENQIISLNTIIDNHNVKSIAKQQDNIQYVKYQQQSSIFMENNQKLDNINISIKDQ